MKPLFLNLAFLLMMNTSFAKPVDTISMENCEDLEFVTKEKVLPRGSALITGSGKLAPSGIKAIVHAAAASWKLKKEPYNPTEESLKNAIINSLILADRFQHKRVALPFIGGGIFFKGLKVTLPHLAKTIVNTANDNARGMEIVFISIDPKQVAAFQAVVSKLKTSNLSVVKGSITDFKVHRASAIVNSGNMEMVFGTGLSGVIGKASGEKAKIDAEAKKMILKLIAP